jgi:predicted small secreted protein
VGVVKKAVIICLLTACASLSACAGFTGPGRMVRLSHVDGSLDKGSFSCVNGNLEDAKSPSGATTRTNKRFIAETNLSYNFSSHVCAAMFAPEEQKKEKSRAMIDSGVTLVKVRCNDFFNAKQTNQGKAR